MRYRTILALIMMLAATMACSLSAVQPTAVPTEIVLDIETDTPTATNTPRPTVAPTSTPGSNNTPCTPRADWTIFYTVVAGDTLGSIAVRTNSSVSALAAGNCLTNPNSIGVGQRLRVPQVPTAPLPPTVTPTLTATPIFGTPPPYQEPVGGVGVSSSISGDAGFVLLLRGETITLTWHEPPPNLYHVTFYLAPPGQPPIAVIGEDSNPADGVTTSWRVPAGLNGHQLYADGRFANGTVVISSYPLHIASARSSESGCYMSAANPEGVQVYEQPSTDSPKFGLLSQDMTVEILGQALNGWYAFDPVQDGNPSVDRLRWVPLDAALEFSGVCEG